jgi:hypothetical protein
VLPERELVAEFCGKPDDMIDSPTPAQEMLYGPKRRRVPAIWDVDLPLLSGSVQNQDAYMQATAGQRPYFFDHVEALADACMEEYAGAHRARLPARVRLQDRGCRLRHPRHGQHDRAGRRPSPTTCARRASSRSAWSI